MVGTGILLRVLRKRAGPILVDLGVAPQRWHLHMALEALARDELHRVIESLARRGGRRSARWELIRQQAVFRCRILREAHEKTMERLERAMASAHLANAPADRLRQAVVLNRRAVALLSRYEADLLRLAAPYSVHETGACGARLFSSRRS